jgi:hypothetical protein
MCPGARRRLVVEKGDFFAGEHTLILAVTLAPRSWSPLLITSLCIGSCNAASFAASLSPGDKIHYSIKMAATTSTALGELSRQTLTESTSPATWNKRTWHLALACLTLSMLLIHGYHPFAEDGGLYVAGIEYLLRPTLFPHDAAFVTAHLHYSIFATTIASLVRITHLPLTWVLLLSYCFSLWLTLYAGLQILRRCFNKPASQFVGLALFSVWATLPVAGTSLLLMDPYLTARSFSTPLSLLAIAFALDAWKPISTYIQSEKYAAPHTIFGNITPAFLLCIGSLLIAALFHPLMASYAVAMVITIRLMRLEKPLLPLCTFGVVTIFIATAINTLAPAESPSVVAAAISRYYWFLSQWQWYELCGLVGPLCILAFILRRQQAASPVTLLCKASIVFGSIAIVIALLFAHESSATHLIARLQPLRGFLLLYALMAMLLGASLSQYLHRLQSLTRILIPAAFLLANASILFYVQRASFPASQHIELPWQAPRNPWSQAFMWSKDNTPTDALFALDARYVNTPGEDAQAFRATALHSSLPDFSKDGGEASITPTLSDLWQQGARVQKDLSTQNDAERDSKLKPLGVTWMILHTDSDTTHRCPYSNSVVKVCSLTP